MTVTMRFCSSCRADVEDAGGFCLLGHPLRLKAPVDSLSGLRAEVDMAFEEAKLEVAAALASAAPAPALATPPAVAVPVRATAIPSPSPPPPPPPRSSAPSRGAVESDAAGDDPITAFAPPPQMDWGPRRARFRRRGDR